MKVSRLPFFASLISLSLMANACEKHAEKEKVSLPDAAVLDGKPTAAEVKGPDESAKTAEAAGASTQTEHSDIKIANGGAAPTEKAGAAAAAPEANVPGASAAKAEAVQLSFPGEVASQRRSTLSFRVGGFIDSIKLKAGNSCKKGAVLATIDSRDYKIAVDIAKSNLELAQVAERNADAEYKREGELKAQNASSESVYDRLKATYENAKANVQLANLRLTQAQQALGDTRLIAPYDCVISKQLTNVGQSVKTGDGAYEVYDVTDIEVSFNVPERLAGRLKLGQKVHVRIPATGYEGDLDLVRVVGVVDEKTRTFQVVAKAPQGDARVVPGLYAEGIVR
ncbi:MAG: efflux RND transporter periplasmic adaptor subunit [Chitinophagaceae bacterium]|nr:efflux RND transporter periplasmic adaptor subunit [Oligoflexus sp.]